MNDTAAVMLTFNVCNLRFAVIIHCNCKVLISLFITPKSVALVYVCNDKIIVYVFA